MIESRTIEGVEVDLSFYEVNGISLHVATAGAGSPILLLHGWPFNWYVWHRILPGLIRAGFRVIAPDLRGIGKSARPADGYDVVTLSNDWAALLAALHAERATVVGFDLGLQSALMLALRYPELVKHLVLTEALAGRLPGAEQFLKSGPPWWFGFHSVKGLAETVLFGREETYLNWFYENSTVQKLSLDSRSEYVRAYLGREALRGGFAHYRAFGQDAQQIEDAVSKGKLQAPTLVVGGGTVKDAPYLQLKPVAEHVRYIELADCGHVTPQEQPEAFLAALIEFVDEHDSDRPSAS